MLQKQFLSLYVRNIFVNQHVLSSHFLSLMRCTRLCLFELRLVRSHREPISSLILSCASSCSPSTHLKLAFHASQRPWGRQTRFKRRSEPASLQAISVQIIHQHAFQLTALSLQFWNSRGLFHPGSPVAVVMAHSPFVVHSLFLQS